MTLVDTGYADDVAFRTPSMHLEHIGALGRHDREPCRGPLVVHLANLAECHFPSACGLHYCWHPAHVATLRGHQRTITDLLRRLR